MQEVLQRLGINKSQATHLRAGLLSIDQRDHKHDARHMMFRAPHDKKRWTNDYVRALVYELHDIHSFRPSAFEGDQGQDEGPLRPPGQFRGILGRIIESGCTARPGPEESRLTNSYPDSDHTRSSSPGWTTWPTNSSEVEDYGGTSEHTASHLGQAILMR